MTELAEHLRISLYLYGRTDPPMRCRRMLPICATCTLADELFLAKKKRKKIVRSMRCLPVLLGDDTCFEMQIIVVFRRNV